MKKLLIGFILILFILCNCATKKSAEKDYIELVKAWTPEVRDAFIGMGRASGCFDLLMVNKSSCFSAVFKYNKNTEKWEVYCERLSQKETPDCYLPNGDPIPLPGK